MEPSLQSHLTARKLLYGTLDEVDQPSKLNQPDPVPKSTDDTVQSNNGAREDLETLPGVNEPISGTTMPHDSCQMKERSSEGQDYEQGQGHNHIDKEQCRFRMEPSLQSHLTARKLLYGTLDEVDQPSKLNQPDPVPKSNDDTVQSNNGVREDLETLPGVNEPISDTTMPHDSCQMKERSSEGQDYEQGQGHNHIDKEQESSEEPSPAQILQETTLIRRKTLAAIHSNASLQRTVTRTSEQTSRESSEASLKHPAHSAQNRQTLQSHHTVTSKNKDKVQSGRVTQTSSQSTHHGTGSVSKGGTSLNDLSPLVSQSDLPSIKSCTSWSSQMRDRHAQCMLPGASLTASRLPRYASATSNLNMQKQNKRTSSVFCLKIDKEVQTDLETQPYHRSSTEFMLRNHQQMQNSRRRLSTAQSLTWKMNSDPKDEKFKGQGGGRLPEVQESLEDVYLEEIELIGEQPKKNREGIKNVRGSLGCCRLFWHDFKLWLKRSNRQQHRPILLGNYISVIEGQFGSGIVSFFMFIRWLLQLNLMLSAIWCGLVVLPQAVGFQYTSITKPFYLRNLLDGKDGMEQSWVFIGGYSAQIFTWYPLSLIYVILILFTYFGSFFILLRSIALAITQEGLEGHDSRFTFTFLTIASWDYSITSRDAVENLSLGISNSLRDHLSEVKAKEELSSMSRKARYLMIARHCVAWMLTGILIGGGTFAIFYVAQSDLSKILGTAVSSTLDGFVQDYGTVLVFTSVNMIVPLCISKLPDFEKYVKPQTELNVTIGRVLVLRMANIFALLLSFYTKFNSGNFTGCPGTLIGQEMYKLVIVDTIVQSALQLPASYIKFYFTRKRSEFSISKPVLETVYRQALIWVGTITCPILPVVGAISSLVIFLTNYAIVKGTCKPPMKRWNQSRHSAFYLALLTCTLSFLLIFLVVIMGRTDIINLGQTSSPGVVCGPFGNNTMLSAFSDFSAQLSVHYHQIGDVLDFLTSGTVVLPISFFLIGLLYYQRLRIRWEKQKQRIASAELLQEREDNRDLRRRLHLLIEDT